MTKKMAAARTFLDPNVRFQEKKEALNLICEQVERCDIYPSDVIEGLYRHYRDEKTLDEIEIRIIQKIIHSYYFLQVLPFSPTKGNIDQFLHHSAIILDPKSSLEDKKHAWVGIFPWCDISEKDLQPEDCKVKTWNLAIGDSVPWPLRRYLRTIQQAIGEEPVSEEQFFPFFTAKREAVKLINEIAIEGLTKVRAQKLLKKDSLINIPKTMIEIEIARFVEKTYTPAVVQAWANFQYKFFKQAEKTAGDTEHVFSRDNLLIASQPWTENHHRGRSLDKAMRWRNDKVTQEELAACKFDVSDAQNFWAHLNEILEFWESQEESGDADHPVQTLRLQKLYWSVNNV